MTLERSMQVDDLRPFAGHAIRVRMVDGHELTGRLRTELLTERSISVYLAGDEGDEAQGTTLYIEDISAIWPIS
jgi:hypothetical protein